VWYRSISVKLIVAVGLVTSVTVGTYAALSLKAQRDQLQQQMVWSAQLLSEVIRRSLHDHMLLYQTEQLHRAIDAIGIQEGIERVRIFNGLGEIIYSSDKPEMGTLVDKSAEQCTICHAREQPFTRLNSSERMRVFSAPDGHRVLGVINPIGNQPECAAAPCHIHPVDQQVLGVLDIDVSLGEADQLLGRLRDRLVLFAVLAMALIAVLISWFVNRLVNHPVHRLLEGTRRVADGRLDTPIAVASKDELGQLAASFNVMTGRLQTFKRELRDSEEKYRSLFENDPNPIFVFDQAQFTIQDVNIRATETYGYSHEEFLAMSFLELGDDEEAEKIRTLAVKCCLFLPRIRHRKKDGSRIYVNIHSCPRSHLGEQVIIANIADITERIQVEAQLIQAGKLATLGEMCTGVAHELNQPLNAIRIGCDYFLKVIERALPFDPEKLQRASRQIIGQVDRAARIIDHLREFGHKQEGAPLELVDLNQPIRDVFTILGEQLRIREIAVSLELDETLPPVRGLAHRLEQVFLNLVTNARDAIEERHALDPDSNRSAAIRIRSRRDGDQALVTVADTGMGVPDKVKDRIFEPFFTTKEVGKGTGLGLSISYGIVKDYGGRIEVTDTPGGGATFLVRLPLAAESLHNHQERPGHEPSLPLPNPGDRRRTEHP